MKKSYLIVGASSGMGTALIKKLLQAEHKTCKIYAHYRNMNNLLDEIVNQNQDVVVPLQADLSNSAQLAEMISTLVNFAEPPLALAHFPANKAVTHRISDFDYRVFETNLRISLFSLSEILKALLPAMRKAKYGRVAVVASSVTENRPPKFWGEYVSEKYALLGFVRSAAEECAEHGIMLNAVAPAMSETKFIDNIDGRQLELLRRNTALKRFVTVDEVAAITAYLLSEDCSATWGQNFRIG
jgi:3-oxoacyl-[acyl-carrier protein] reductase